MIDNQAIESIKQNVSILDLVSASGLTVVQRGGKYSTQEHDSLILYPAKNTWSWFSQGDQRGKTLGGDVYQWYTHHHRCSFAEAHEALSRMAGTLPVAPVATVTAHVHSVSATTGKDQRRAATDAQRTLQSSIGKPVMDYLNQRGISLETATAWGLGAHCSKDWGWGVAFPYVNVLGHTVINFRVINRIGGDKCIHWGNRGGLFGLERTQPDPYSYLFATEGEMNAISISQATGWLGVDAVSFGNKGLNPTVAQKLVHLSSLYRHLFVWTDEEADTRKALTAIPNAIGLKSPRLDGKKLDANDMLQRGWLTAFLVNVIDQNADREGANRLNHALYRQHTTLDGGLDAETLKAAKRSLDRWRNKQADTEQAAV